MAIPKNILKEHLVKAIQKIDNEGIPKDGDSQYYDVILDGKKYPPKVIVSYANIFANGVELDRKSFSGGVGTECFVLLEKNGFFIQKKSVSYYVLGASWVEGEMTFDQTERFITKGIWENGYTDKFIDVVNGVNVGDRVAIKSSFAKGKVSILRVKAIGTVLGNRYDGRTLDIQWDNNFIQFDLEGYGRYRNTIQIVSDDDVDAIFKKMENLNFYPQIVKFLAQARTHELGTSGYQSKLQGLTVKVSFGKGNQARIPWIAFLNDIDTVQDGIYPVYLYYKDKDLLILAYGVSETKVPKRSWNISNGITINKYFEENKLGRADRYGGSFVYNTYFVNNSLSEEEVNIDLTNLISIYKGINVISHPNPNSNLELGLDYPFNQKKFTHGLDDSGLRFTEKFVLRFIASLLTKPFVILTGLSGSGKTKLAQAFVQWICETASQYRIIPVGADWTNREPLLGYPNALNPKEYVKPDSGVLDLIIQANNHPDLPHFLILDEMNLSHVERYFADFLSVMESNEEISLYTEGTVENGVPAKLKVPSNLFIIGTVNIDETTNMFSPKVLDRANTIEFRVSQDEMRGFLGNIKEINMEALAGKGAGMAKSFLDMAASKSFATQDIDAINASLILFFGELKKTGAEFGYRSAKEILRLIHQLSVLDNTLTTNQKIDIAIVQKLLPKLHGSQRKLCRVLETLGSFCVSGDVKIIKDVLGDSGFDFNSSNVLYPLSLEKIARMYRGAIDNGFASFAEA